MKLSKSVIAGAIAAFLTACGGGGTDSGQQQPPASNVAPTANAGSIQNLLIGTTVTMDGSGSDANGDTLTYKWSLIAPSGSTSSLSGATTPKPTFVADVAGTYSAALVVNDGKLNSTAATVTITAAVANATPVANAGVAQNVLAGTLVTLDGSASSDANGDLLTYGWSLTSKPAGSAAVFAFATSAKPTFTADLAGTYVASLSVNDGKVNSTAVTVTVTAGVANVAPVANAGVAQNVVAGTLVTLDGSASSDANGDLLTYSWSLTGKPADSAAALASAASARPTLTADLAGTYVASLTVNDGKVNSTAATVTIAAAVANVAPVANAGVAQNVVAGTLVTVDGSASSDANGDLLTYSWSLTSRPAGSTAALALATSAKPTFTADLAGTYVASLAVNDGKVNSTASTVTITASTVNAAPVALATTKYRYVYTGSVIAFSGARSSDANGDQLSYKWTLVSKPPSSGALLQNAFGSAPTITPDRLGDYVVSLTVNDGRTDSSNQSVATITALISPIPTDSGIFANTLYIPVGVSGLDKTNSKITYQIRSDLNSGVNVGSLACDAFAATDVDESTGVVRALSADGKTIYDIDINSGSCITQINSVDAYTAMTTYREGSATTARIANAYAILISANGRLIVLDKDGSQITSSPLSVNLTGIDFDANGQLWGFGEDAIWKLSIFGSATRVAYGFGLAGFTTNDIDIGSDGIMKVTSKFQITYINLVNYTYLTKNYSLQLGAIFSR